jgi:hypothetical protein
MLQPEEAEESSVCDALLFSMQTHTRIESIQLTGCGILSCLASASCNNKEITDGTLSGALSMVLNAMANHRSSKSIQKAGIQALHSQCVLSANAESNKRSLLEFRVDSGNGASGMDVIVQAMETLQHVLVSLEWACK